MGNWLLCLRSMEESLQQAWKECQMWSKDITTKRRQKKSQVSPSVLLPTDGGGGGEKGKCPAQLVQGSQRRNQLQRNRTGPSLSGLGAELDWLQGPVIKVKSQHSGPDSRKPNLTCPLSGQLSSQPARLQLLQPGQLQKNWVKAEKESHGV